jgi:pyruvate formate-lyase/glycerol dehydratase family glycyl radical enzyme
MRRSEMLAVDERVRDTGVGAAPTERVGHQVNERVRGSDVSVLTERVKRMREEGRQSRIQGDGERARAFMAGWKENENQPIAIRRAQAFRRYLETCTVVIFDGELLVGSPTRFMLGSHPYLEFSSELCRDVVAGQEFTIRRETEKGTITEEDRAALAEATAYWTGRSTGDLIHQSWSEVLGDSFLAALRNARLGSLVDATPPSTKTADYPKVLSNGFRGLIAEAKAQLAGLDYEEKDAMERRWMLDGMIITLEAMITYASRYAQKARELAETECDAGRKSELLQIAENCSWVPLNPPRTFWETLQFFWFVHLGLHLEVAGSNEVPGRMDQYLYPYYLRDLENGRVSRDQAGELLGCLWVKFNNVCRWNSKARQDYQMGSQQQYVTIGGVTPEGEDATNEMSFLLLEVARQMKLRQPSIAIRWHKRINQDLLLKGIETNVELGGGIPSFLNDDNAIPNLMSYGVSQQDARDWAAMGCVHTLIPAKQVSGGRTAINPVKIFEMTLNNGVDPVSGKLVGIETGDPRTFTSVAELEEAFKKQWQYWVRRLWKATCVARMVKLNKDVIPYTSAVQTDCISKGKDILSGDVGYPQLMFGFNIRGFQGISNSLAAIQKVVFEEKQATMADVLDALANNFDGYEKLQQRLIAAPKWGNDDDYVDKIHQRLFKWAGEWTRHEAVFMGMEHSIERGGATWHHFAGKVVGATPDGRKAFELLADGTISAAQGTDTHGPTAVINSALKLDQTTSVSNLFNLKFPASLLREDEQRKKLLGLITTYFEGGGYHVQFNIIDAETLRRARAHPEEYRDLMVRVGGFSVYFVELPTQVQDEIISRTEQGL